MNTLTAVQILEVTKDTAFTNVGDALSFGLPLSLFGFATVFAVLILIWAILALFKVFFYTIPNAKKNGATPKVEPKKEAVVKAAEAPVAVTAAPVANKGNDGEIVAAIIAAIEAYRAGTGHAAPGGFRVVSFKKRI